jgi:hypothetical protein
MVRWGGQAVVKWPVGPHRLKLMISGRSPKSTGYLVAIDRIVLTRIGS